MTRVGSQRIQLRDGPGERDADVEAMLEVERYPTSRGAGSYTQVPYEQMY